MSRLKNKEIFDILLPLCKCDKAHLIELNIQRVKFNNDDFYSIDVFVPSLCAPMSIYPCQTDASNSIRITFSCSFEYLNDYKHICNGAYSKISESAMNIILDSCVSNYEFWKNVFVKDIDAIISKIKSESSIKSTEILKDLAEVYYESNLELYKPLNELRYETD